MALFAFFVMMLVFGFIALLMVFWPYKSYRGYRRRRHKFYTEINEHVKFKSGNVHLNGFIYGSDNKKGLIIFSQSMGVPSDYYIPEALYFMSLGYKVFLFDNTGYWRNKGLFLGFPQAVKDLYNAIKHVDDGRLPLTLIGHSMGGYSVCAVMNYDDINPVNVVSYSGFNSLNEVIVHTAKKKIGAFAPLVYLPLCLFERLIFKRLVQFTAADGINKKNSRVFIVHGAKDCVVNINTTGIYGKKSLITNKDVHYHLVCEEGFESHMGVVRKDHTKDVMNIKTLDYIAYNLK